MSREFPDEDPDHDRSDDLQDGCLHVDGIDDNPEACDRGDRTFEFLILGIVVVAAIVVIVKYLVSK